MENLIPWLFSQIKTLAGYYPPDPVFNIKQLPHFGPFPKSQIGMFSNKPFGQRMERSKPPQTVGASNFQLLLINCNQPWQDKTLNQQNHCCFFQDEKGSGI